MTPPDTAPELRACAVRVPCSTSNLGAGFDCIGLAFNRCLDAGYEPGVDALHVRRAGTLHGLDIAIEDDVLATAFTAELTRRGVDGVRGTLHVTSTIPVGVGLGSSGAATVAGIALATAACGAALDRAAALAAAVRLEGHPDNAAPALFGGLVAIAYAEHSVPRAMRLPLSPDIAFAFAAPAGRISTQRARAALPQHVPHSAAVRNLGRMAALLHGLANADADALAIGLSDELHVPYRMPLIAGAADVIRAAAEAGAWGATISGSGSGLIALCAADTGDDVLDAMRAAFTKVRQRANKPAADDAGISAFVLRPDMHGAQPRDMRTLRDAMPA